MKSGRMLVIVMVTGALSLMLRRQAFAGGLGIPLDAFISTFVLFVQGLGLVLGTVGLAGWIASLFDNPFSTLLAGSVGFFTKAGMLGGGLVILPQLGLVAGAVLR
jgi:hypothetical protein